MNTAYKTTTKTQMRQDLKNARHILRIIEQAIATNDYETVETWARELESTASLLACDAKEKAEALDTIGAGE
jgi:hypothetical protein